jgi:carbohydrate-binding DOMON domain-containing protein
MIGLNSQYLLPRGYEYDRLILVGGGIGVRDENNNVLCEYLPRAEDAANPIGDPVTKTVRFSLPRHLLGTPTKKWKMIILIGGQDDHGGAGIGEFRSVEQNASEWTGGGKPKQDLPNIYDDLIIKP